VTRYSKDPEALAKYWDSININGGVNLALPMKMATPFVETILSIPLQSGRVELVSAKDKAVYTMPPQGNATSSLSCKHFVSLG
jgi:hypothetical protein